MFVTWKKIVNGGEPRLRGCIGTLEARHIIDGFKDYALTRYGGIKVLKLSYSSILLMLGHVYYLCLVIKVFVDLYVNRFINSYVN